MKEILCMFNCMCMFNRAYYSKNLIAKLYARETLLPIKWVYRWGKCPSTLVVLPIRESWGVDVPKSWGRPDYEIVVWIFEMQRISFLVATNSYGSGFIGWSGAREELGMLRGRGPLSPVVTWSAMLPGLFAPMPIPKP